MGRPIFHSQYTAAQIEASIGKTPRIKAATRTWEIWDIATSAYVDTGVSIDTELFVDNTLTEAGYAADAKVTGDKIGELKSALGVADIDSVLLGGGTGESWASAEVLLADRINYLVVIPAFSVRSWLTSSYVIATIKGYVSSSDTTGIVLYQVSKRNYDNKAIQYALDNTQGAFYKVEISVRAEQNTSVAVTVSVDVNRLIGNVYSLAEFTGKQFVTLEMGNISISSSGWTYSNSTTRVRLANGTTVHLKQGDTIGLKSYSGYVYYLGWKKTVDGTYASAGWLGADFPVSDEGDYTILMRCAPETTTNVSTFESLLFFRLSNSLQDRIDDLSILMRNGYNLINLNSISDGYFETNGTVHQGSYGEKYCADYIPVTPGGKIAFLCTSNVTGASFMRAITYDGSLARISHITLSKTPYAFDYYLSGLGYNWFEFEIPSGVYYIRISWRAYGNEFGVMLNSKKTTVAELEDIRETIANVSSYHTNSFMKGINHAGYTMEAPENTLPAYKLSRKHGFAYVECDVQFTSDNIPVLLHDDTINRTARNSDGTEISETVYISNITYEQALTYDFGIYKGQEYAGTKIPTLEQFANLCKNLGLHPYIELKTGATQAQTNLAVNAVRKCGMLNNVTWCSFSSDILGYVKTAYQRARLGYVVSTINSDAIAAASALKIDHNEVFIDANYENLTAERINLCINADLPLEIWTLNDLSTYGSLNAYVTGVTSDRFNADAVNYSLSIN